MRDYPEIAVCPDTQVKEGVPTDHITAFGNYCYHRRPDIIVHLGDHWDMPSLSAWDSSAKKVAEKSFYMDAGGPSVSRGDIGSGNQAMKDLIKAIHGKSRTYRPKIIRLIGNHEHRITRAIEERPEYRGALSLKHLYSDHQEVVPYLKVKAIAGVAFSHFFPLNAKGKVTQSKNGPASAQAMLRNVGMSCIAGHQQGLDQAMHESPAGRKRAIIAGSFYQHRESYLTEMGNDHWQGCLYLHEVHRGDFDLMELSMRYLLNRWA